MKTITHEEARYMMITHPYPNVREKMIAYIAANETRDAAIPQAIAALERAITNAEECSCLPWRTDEDGNIIESNKCLLCELRAALAAMKGEK